MSDEFVHRIAGGEDTLAELQRIVDLRKQQQFTVGDRVIVDGNPARVGTVTALNTDREFPFEVTFVAREDGLDCDIAEDFAAHRLAHFQRG